MTQGWETSDRYAMKREHEWEREICVLDISYLDFLQLRFEYNLWWEEKYFEWTIGQSHRN